MCYTNYMKGVSMVEKFDPTSTYKVSSDHIILTQEAWDSLVRHHNELVGEVNKLQTQNAALLNAIRTQQDEIHSLAEVVKEMYANEEA